MKKAVIFSLAFALLISSALGADFSGYKYPGDKFTLNGDNFSIQLTPDWKTIAVKYNDEGLLIKNNSCEDTSLNYYTICYRNAVIDLEEGGKNVGRLEENGELSPGINISIIYKKPNLTATQGFDTLTPLLGQEVLVSLNITNKGKNPATIIFIEPIDEGFAVTPGEELAFDGKNLQFNGYLGAGSTRTLTYTIKPQKFVNSSFIGNLSYTYEGLNGHVATAKTVITVKDNVELNATYQKSMKVAQKEDFTIKIINKDQKSFAEVNLRIIIPPEIIVTSKDSKLSEESAQTYRYSQNINKNEDDSIKIGIQTTKTGNYTIKAMLNYTIYGEKRTVEKNYSIKVNASAISPELILPLEMIGSNQNITIKAAIKNNDEKTQFYNLKTTVKSDILSHDATIPLVIQNQDITLFEKNIIAPTVSEKKDFNITINGEYETITKEKFFFNLTKKITVYPPKDTIIIYHQIDNRTNLSNALRLIIYIENKRDVQIPGVAISEEIPEGFQAINGSTQAEVTLEPKRKMQVFFYTIVPVGNSTKAGVSTTLSFKETTEEFNVRQSLIIDVAKKNITTANITETLKNGTYFKEKNTTKNSTATATQKSKSQTSPEAQPEKSFFRRIIDWFSNLF